MRRNEHGAHPMTSETLDGLIAAAISEAQSIAREVGTVHSVASRRSQPDRDHLQMLARLDMWRSRMFGISERLLAALRISSSQQDGEKVCALCGDFRRSSFPTLKTPAPRQTQEK